MSNNSNTHDYNPEEIIKKETRGLGNDTDIDDVRNFRRIHNNTKRQCS